MAGAWVRLGPAEDATAVTADQLCDVVNRLIEAGRWREGDPQILIVTAAPAASPS